MVITLYVSGNYCTILFYYLLFILDSYLCLVVSPQSSSVILEKNDFTVYCFEHENVNSSTNNPKEKQFTSGISWMN